MSPGINSHIVVNYTEALAQLRDLATPNCTARAAFLEGAPHFGKSFLLEHLKSEANIRVVSIALDKRRIVPTPLQVLAEIATHLDFQNFPTFDEALHRQRRPLQATVSNVSVEGSYVNVQAIAQESEEDLLMTAILATNAFLADLRQLPHSLRPLIVAFDGYDVSMSLIDRWFDSVLVQGVCSIEHMRLIICGRELSATTLKQRSLSWPCVEVSLTGINDEREWMPMITALKRDLPGSDDASRGGYLRGIVAAFKGAPGLIVAHLKTLPGG